MESSLYHSARRAAALAVALLAGALATRAHAQHIAADPGAELSVYLATFGPGAAVWEKFGHNAIWIRDRLTGTTISYNYGIFDFHQAGFVPRLMRGNMLYKMDVRDAELEAAYYASVDRTVWVQRLDMTAAQKFALREFLEASWQQNEGEYLYDYFRDNCSTRVRDALDHALGGAIRRTLSGQPTETTYRSHSLRLTAASLATYTGLVLGLGLPTDGPIDAWEESFIPMRLMAHLREVTLTGADASTRPLVMQETTQHLSRREPPPDEAPARTIFYFLTGLLLGAGILWLAHRGRTAARARLGWSLAAGLWGVLTGFFGLILALLWLFTNHTAAYPNLNLLQVNPLGFLFAAAAPLAFVRATGPAGGLARLAWRTAIAIATLSATGLLLQLVPSLRQMNGPILALALPVHFAFAASFYHRFRGGPSSEEDVRARMSVKKAA